MADKAPTTSRRGALAILSASCLVPASALAAPVVIANRGAWERARDAYIAAHHETQRPGLTDAEVYPLSDREGALFAAMLDTRVPDLAAMLEKMELGMANVWAWSDAEQHEVEALLADVRNLAGRA